MDVMFTTHPKDDVGKYYMVVAEKGEWERVVDMLWGTPSELTADHPAWELIQGLKSWGIEAE